MTRATTHRAALLGLAMFAIGCDLAQLASNDPPRFEETWNLPGPDTRMSVADLLPSGVTIKPDSSAFTLTIDSTTFQAQLGPNCAACGPLNGTNAIKPAFSMQPGNSTALPADIVSAAIIAGQIQIKLTNNLTFDPLYVSTGGGSPPQGHLVIVVRSGSVVLGRDSIRGAAAVSGVNMPFNPGSTLTRNIALSTGTVTTNLTVDVSMSSPAGDHLVPIDISKTFNASATVPNLEVASVSMNVTNQTFDTEAADEIEMPATGDFIVGLGMDMTITNPFPGLNGGLGMEFSWGPGPSDKVSTDPITLPNGTAVRQVRLDSAKTQQLLNASENVSIKLTGSVNSVAPITVTPKQEVSITNRLIMKFRVGGGS
jgi:hypothetical protein